MAIVGLALALLFGVPTVLLSYPSNAAGLCKLVERVHGHTTVGPAHLRMVVRSLVRPVSGGVREGRGTRYGLRSLQSAHRTHVGRGRVAVRSRAVGGWRLVIWESTRLVRPAAHGVHTARALWHVRRRRRRRSSQARIRSVPGMARWSRVAMEEGPSWRWAPGGAESFRAAGRCERDMEREERSDGEPLSANPTRPLAAASPPCPKL